MFDPTHTVAAASTAPPRGCRPVTVFASITAIGVLATVLFCLAAPRQLTGVAAPITIDGHPSGVYRLSVVRSLFPVSSERSSSAATPGARTDDQASSEERGWFAACATWKAFGAFQPGQGLACFSTTHLPAVAYTSPSTGQSANLANALAFADWHFDITGDVLVAATGELHVSRTADPATGAVDIAAHVRSVGGAPQKAEAAVAAGVDLLLVPAEQVEAFAAAPALAGSGVELVGVDTVRTAVWELCSRSVTKACVEHVLPFE